MNVLEVQNLTKKFGKFTAVDDVTFSLKKGEILGFLGPNGAGKTTTIQMLMGVLTPTVGKVSYFGKEFKSHRSEILERLNFSSTYTNLPWLLTVKECLTYTSYLYDIKNRSKKINELVEIFKLEKLLGKRINSLSAGQTTRVNIAKAFLNSPDVLLLDEPTASLDPDIALYIRNYLLEYNKNHEVSIIITSHNMSEVTEICQRVIFINSGKLIANDTPQNLSRTIKTSHLELTIVLGQGKLEKLLVENNYSYNSAHNKFTIDIEESKIAEFLNQIHKNNIKYSEISIDKPTLEDYFLEMSLNENK